MHKKRKNIKTDFLFIILIVFGIQVSFSQKSTTLEKFKIQDFDISVKFFDPYKNIIEEFPNFEKLEVKKQEEIWNNYLLNHIIYEFQLIHKNTTIKKYVVKGNSEMKIDAKVITNNKIYLLEIINHTKNKTTSTIKKLNIYGTLFENMEILKNEERLGLQLFGHFRLKIPYSTIKSNVSTLILKDLNIEN
ncbi:hypothetical protein [Aureivirga marina]|uniref:hypothetical protein n=1 Tax=Aureivirga marina TaxID=1182451 RepID=UPI0018CAEE58|nr:hypothetical protein [Aureivirga marina]